MENKINIAELLKDCPQGMELDCAICNNVVTLEGIDKKSPYPINVKGKDGYQHTFTWWGGVYDHEDSKCVIFPKGKTTWEGFHRPFKDGDIVTWEDRGSLVAFIYKERKDVAVVKHHFALYTGSLGTVTDGEISLVENEIVFATEEEKQKLFDAIKVNGYKWNPETKILERLPKFKVGDRIKHKGSGLYCTLGEYSEGISAYRTDIGLSITSIDLEQWELMPNKFDISKLIPFESKVLVRHHKTSVWMPAIFGGYDIPNLYYYAVGGTWWKYCIPYKGNEYLRGTADDCNAYYKTWEK